MLLKLCQNYFSENNINPSKISISFIILEHAICSLYCIKFNHKKKVAYMHDISVCCWAHAYALKKIKIESHRKLSTIDSISREIFSVIDMHLILFYWKEKLRANTFYCLACYCSCWKFPSTQFLEYISTELFRDKVQEFYAIISHTDAHCSFRLHNNEKNLTFFSPFQICISI